MRSLSDEGNRSLERKIGPKTLSAIIATISFAIFLMDVSIPVGKAAGVYYVIPMVLTIFYSNPRAPWAVALVLTPLMIGGFLMKPPGTWETAVFNRPTAVGMVFFTAAIVWSSIRYRNIDAERKKLLNTVLSLTPDMIRIFDVEQEKDVYCNKAVDGIGSGSMKNRSPLESIIGTMDPNDQEYWRSESKDLRDYPESSILQREIEVEGEDGRTRKLIDKQMVFKRDREGRPMQYLHVSTDATEIIDAKERVKREKEWFHVLLESIGDGIIATDRLGRISLMNGVAERLTGYSKEDSQGKPLHEIFHTVDEVTLERKTFPKMEVIDQGKVVEFSKNMCLMDKSGKTIHISDSGAPIVMQDGTIIGMIIAFKDVTNEHLMNIELERLQRLESIGTLAGGIAHDFNNLLMGIYGNITLAMELVKDDSEVGERLQAAEVSMERAKILSNRLLTFSTGGKPIIGRTSPRSIVEGGLRFVLSGSSTDHELMIDDDLWDVWADPVQITQVFNNVVRNAVESMSDGGKVDITLSNYIVKESDTMPIEPGRYVCITVEDHGCGIDPLNMTKVFDPYFTTKDKKTGLGLSIAHSIISKHNGFIKIDSEVGRGTTVNIYIPALEIMPSDEETRCTVPKGVSDILIMDDQCMILEVMEEMLEGVGYRVDRAEDGQVALEKYLRRIDEGRPYDLVIMDLTIPGGMGGRETIKRLLEIDGDARAIVASGYSNDATMSEYWSFGFKGMIAKPFTKAQLIDEIEKVLGTGN